jgi:leader peptidase (prepilin peptidase)/N-methyltransferase
MNMVSVMSFFSVLFGLILGSFINVCIYRIPLRISIIHPPSSCPDCYGRIRFYDNIPLISYLFLFGKCRHCHQHISWQYPVVESLTGVLSLALFTRFGLSFQYLLLLLFTGSLVTITFIDLRHKIIPDVLSIPGIIVGFGVSPVFGPVTWLDSLIGIVAGGGALFVIAFSYERLAGREGMGGGDIKLLAMIGAWMGWQALPFIVLISSLTGSIVGCFFILFSGKGYRVRIPFGPFLSLGTLMYIFFGADMINWYLNLF